MATIEVRPVRSRRERHVFMTFPWQVYRHDPLWVPPLLSERRKVIDPSRGAFFARGGVAEFAIAWRNGRPAGTIAAAEDPAANQARGKRECIFGFFEYFEDKRVFAALVNWAAAWGRARGLNLLYGPWNLDYEDAYGVLVDGRDRPPVLMCGHTPAYYQHFMEQHGFFPARCRNIAFALNLATDNEETQHLSRLADRIRKRGAITIRGARLNDWSGEVDRVYRLMTAALGPGGSTDHGDYIPWHRDQLEQNLLPLRGIVDPELVLFAEDEGEAIGWFPGMPNLNEHFQKVNGLRYPWNTLHLLLLLRRQTECLAIKSVLVLPERQGLGAAVLMFDEMRKRARAKGYKWLDFSITSEDNPNTPALATRFGAQVYKRWQVYHFRINN